jgi:hypothetical protein
MISIKLFIMIAVAITLGVPSTLNSLSAAQTPDSQAYMLTKSAESYNLIQTDLRNGKQKVLTSIPITSSTLLTNLVDTESKTAIEQFFALSVATSDDAQRFMSLPVFVQVQSIAVSPDKE